MRLRKRGDAGAAGRVMVLSVVLWPLVLLVLGLDWAWQRLTGRSRERKY